MSVASESDDKLVLRNCADSSSVDDDNRGRYEGGNGPLKKGPWSAAEDAILVEYVIKYGEGNWNAMQKHSGLARCGKSCRLRWANHLRPDLKKGAFTPEEERRVVELHAKSGNKWARMATELPGRTDNEIKNFWNTRIKRRQRAGLPIYPPDICLQPINENQQNDINGFSLGSAHHPDFMPNNNFESPALEFKNLELNQQLYPPELLDIPSSTLMAQSLDPSYPSKRLKGFEPLFPCLNAAFGNFTPCGSQYQNSQPLIMLSSTYDHNLTCHSLNSILSTSEPSWAMKLELPSLQTPQTVSWGGSPSSPLPSIDSVDILIQTALNEQTQSCNTSPRNSGLLEAVLYEAKGKNNSNVVSHGPTLHASDMAVNVIDTSSHDLHETEWEAYGESISPLGHSPSLLFSEGNSLDEPQLLETAPGCKYKAAATSPIHMQSRNHEAAIPNHKILSRPDMLLGLNCFDPTKDHAMFKDAIGTLLGDDDLNRDCKQRNASASSSARGHRHAWNTMSLSSCLTTQFDEF